RHRHSRRSLFSLGHPVRQRAEAREPLTVEARRGIASGQRVRPSGKINLIAVLILAGVFAGIYWCIFFLPKYLDHLSVKEAVEASYADSKRYDEKVLFSQIKTRTDNPDFGMHRELNDNGESVEKPGLGLTEENI